jgi:hypothetical protein
MSVSKALREAPEKKSKKLLRGEPQVLAMRTKTKTPAGSEP